MKKLFTLLVLLSVGASAQEKSFKTEEVSVNELLEGTLYTPDVKKKTNLVILIAGSGPTDRDGNSMIMNGNNNSLKYLAEGLAENGISVYSYDKRMFALMKSGAIDESKLLFEHFIDDAVAIAKFFKKQKKYKKIIFAGHSEGSLVGMVACEKIKADGFVSIAGAGSPIDNVLINQSAPYLVDDTKAVLEELKKGNTVEIKNPALLNLFRPSVQPYMISWLKYNPQTEIQKLKVPVMIVNGTSDLQVLVSEAELLHKVKPDANYLIIENMNHVLKEVKDLTENQNSYTNPDLPVAPELINGVSSFVKSIK